MKKISRAIDIILYILVTITLLTALSSAIWKKPILFVSVRSNSMYPSFQRSDVLLIKNLSKEEEVDIGDIVVFKTDEGSLASKGWIVHRVIEGNDEMGFITKGDANEYTDQNNGSAPIKREWIACKVITINGQPLKIPLIGYLSLWMEGFQKNPFTMPIIAVILAVIIGISELLSNKKGKKKRKSKGNMDKQLIYFFGGLTISIIIGATMLASSQRIIIPYEVSSDRQGVIMGSSVGIIKVGEKVEKPLIELSNQGFIPFTSTITTNDDQITFSRSLVPITPGTELTVDMILKAEKPGTYNSTIYAGMFYPFLPSQLIYTLAAKSYWLALIIVSLIPGLPLLLYPVIDRKMRRKTVKEIRRLYRRIQRSIPLFN